MFFFIILCNFCCHVKLIELCKTACKSIQWNTGESPHAAVASLPAPPPPVHPLSLCPTASLHMQKASKQFATKKPNWIKYERQSRAKDFPTITQIHTHAHTPTHTHSNGHTLPCIVYFIFNAADADDEANKVDDDDVDEALDGGVGRWWWWCWWWGSWWACKHDGNSCGLPRCHCNCKTIYNAEIGRR